MQTYEGFMPSDLSITSYGHCYYVLILAHLVKSGISNSDDEITACLNFSEHLAYQIYKNGAGKHPIGEESFDEFLVEYKNNYVIRDSTVNRMLDRNYGIVARNGQFRNPYMYYYFLGKYLAKNSERCKDIIEEMCDRSYVTSNCLALIFTIHHTNDGEIIDEILLRTMCALDDIEPSVLDRNEAKVFEDIVMAIPSEVLSDKSVQAERNKIRKKRDNVEDEGLGELDDRGDKETVDSMNDAYRIMKNTEVLGQILKNKYGGLERDKIVEIIETIADGRLRLVGMFLGHQVINNSATFFHKKNPEVGIDEIKRLLRAVSFFWTMYNVEQAVSALNKPELRSLVEEVVAKRDTPAYDLIGYFLQLDTVEKFAKMERRQLKKLLKKHQYEFFKKVISIRTQWYLNSHRVETRIEQAVCSLLGVQYRPRLKRLE